MKYVEYSLAHQVIADAPQDQLVVVCRWSRWCDKCPPFLDAISVCEEQFTRVVFFAVEIENLGVFDFPALPSISLFWNGVKIHDSFGVADSKALAQYLGEWGSLLAAKQHPLLKAKSKSSSPYRSTILSAAIRLEALSVRMHSAVMDLDGEFTAHSEKLSNQKYLDELVSTVRVVQNSCYIIESVGASKNLIAKVKTTVENMKQSAFDYPRINRAVGHVLYVGKSKKLALRLKQHLGSSAEGTYALHMARWGHLVPMRIRVSWFVFTEDSILNQAIEDALWDGLQPAFGRKGAR